MVNAPLDLQSCLLRLLEHYVAKLGSNWYPESGFVAGRGLNLGASESFLYEHTFQNYDRSPECPIKQAEITLGACIVELLADAPHCL